MQGVCSRCLQPIALTNSDGLDSVQCLGCGQSFPTPGAWHEHQMEGWCYSDLECQAEVRKREALYPPGVKPKPWGLWWQR
jgi:hypothetical protein